MQDNYELAERLHTEPLSSTKREQKEAELGSSRAAFQDLKPYILFFPISRVFSAALALCSLAG